MRRQTYSVVICTIDRQDDITRSIRSWLRQDPPPLEIIVVHGKDNRSLETYCAGLIAGSDVAFKYVNMPPSLVRQRNAGAAIAVGDIVFFADDDGEYLEGYARAILAVYEADVAGEIGGVQGTIVDFDGTIASRWGLATVFQLPRMGRGTLQPSGWPAFYKGKDSCAPVEVFSGVSMSFRGTVLREFQFDETLAQYWLGDDFEMAYRVSRKYRLFQVQAARLIHHLSPAGRDGTRRHAKMAVVNHLYLSQKFFGNGLVARLCWAWAEIGNWVLALLWVIAGRGTSRLAGMTDGYSELLTNGGPPAVRPGVEKA